MFRKKITKIADRINRRSKERTKFRWSVAALFLILIGVASIFWISTNIRKTDSLYYNNYRPYPVEDLVRDDESTLENAIKLYAKKRYYEAIPELRKLYITRLDFSNLKLYLASSFLSINQEQKAIDVIKKIDEGDRQYENAQWYLVLSYLKLEDRRNSIELLEQVIKYNGVYKKDAEALLNKLREIWISYIEYFKQKKLLVRAAFNYCKKSLFNTQGSEKEYLILEYQFEFVESDSTRSYQQ